MNEHTRDCLIRVVDAMGPVLERLEVSNRYLTIAELMDALRALRSALNEEQP